MPDRDRDAPEQDQTRLSGIGPRLGGADSEGAAGGLDAAAASGTIEAEDAGDAQANPFLD
jgi:hypothetical protein